MVGGGQLARMMIPPAINLNIDLRPLVEAQDGATGQVAPTALVARADDLELLKQVIKDADVLTFEHEHIPQEVLQELSQLVAIRPSPAAMLCAQNKLVMRQKLEEIGVPVPAWGRATTEAEVEEFGAHHGFPMIAKTPTGGYDGKGVRLLHDSTQARDWLQTGPILLEQCVEFERELAVLLARNPSDQVAHWPVVQTIQAEGVCSQVLAPAPQMKPELAQQAQELGTRIARALDVTGVLAVEMFQIGEQLYVNELAMRPHNCGHWTIEGSATSQFEQHLRAVLDLPLGPTTMRGEYWVMQNLLGCDTEDTTNGVGAALTAVPEANIHLYGKAVRPGRKLGHVTVTAATHPQAQARAATATEILYRGNA